MLCRVLAARLRVVNITYGCSGLRLAFHAPQLPWHWGVVIETAAFISFLALILAFALALCIIVSGFEALVLGLEVRYVVCVPLFSLGLGSRRTGLSR